VNSLNGLNEFYHNIELGNAHLCRCDEITCKFALFPSYGPLKCQIKLIFKMDVKMEVSISSNRSTMCIMVGPQLLWLLLEELDLLRFKFAFENKEMVFNVFLFNYE
jgi:hypothetical protein